MIRSGLRWLVAGGIGVAVTFSLFVMMTKLAEGPSILQRIFRIFPLTRAELSTTEECARAGSVLADAFVVEGTVGTNGSGGFRPLVNATAIGRNAISDTIEVDVSSGGQFRFVTSFGSEAPTPCGENVAPTGGENQQLTLRAPGCMPRNVPVTRAWVPHQVLLDCADEG